METDVCAATRYWVEKVIIGLNFCPFAAEVFNAGRIRCVPCEAMGHEEICAWIHDECKRLHADESIATTLLVLSRGCTHFLDFLDCVDIANEVLREHGYEGVYQLAHFHPQYCFTGEDAHDPSNFTNRSPFPTLHIIRELDIEHALEQYANPEQIPQRNIARARERGAEYFQNILQEAYQQC